VIRLVTRGDDAGSSKSANRAIHAAAKKGILRNATVLATGPGVIHAAKALGGLVKSGNLCIGLQAAVTCESESPFWGTVLDAKLVPSLVDENGMRHRTVEALMAKDAPVGKVRAETLAEIAAQLERLRSLGLGVKYIDENTGLGGIDGVVEGVAGLAKREGLVFRPPLEKLAQPAPEAGTVDYASRLLAALEVAEEGTYLVAGRPAFVEEEKPRYPGAEVAEDEEGRDLDAQRLMFTRKDVIAWCRANDVRLLRYDEIV
jgi:predicted glycoside hydrolase/deacetylase ChbG (UPF0249 family)